MKEKEPLPQKALKEFRKIYQEEFGRLLNLKECRWLAVAFIHLIKTIAKPTKKT